MRWQQLFWKWILTFYFRFATTGLRFSFGTSEVKRSWGRSGGRTRAAPTESSSSSTPARRTDSKRPSWSCSRSGRRPATSPSSSLPTSKTFRALSTSRRSNLSSASKNSARVTTGTSSRRAPSPGKVLTRVSRSCTSSSWIGGRWRGTASAKTGSSNLRLRLLKVREKFSGLTVIITEWENEVSEILIFGRKNVIFIFSDIKTKDHFVLGERQRMKNWVRIKFEEFFLWQFCLNFCWLSTKVLKTEKKHLEIFLSLITKTWPAHKDSFSLTFSEREIKLSPIKRSFQL